MDCHMTVDDKIDLRPKKRNMSVGLVEWEIFQRAGHSQQQNTHEVFIRPSTIGAASPAGLRAGAKAINTSIFLFNWGWILRAAKAWAVP